MIGTLEGVVGQEVILRGYAQDYEKSIVALQFSGDEGKTWTEYPTEGAEQGVNVNWSFGFMPQEEGVHHFLIRTKTVDERVTPEPAHVYVKVYAEKSMLN